MEKDQNHAKTYKGHLCFSRCLAIGKFSQTYHSYNNKAKKLFDQYCEHFQVTPDEFKGIELEDFYALENFYEVQLFATILKEDGIAETLYLSQTYISYHLSHIIYQNPHEYLREYPTL